MGWNHQLDRLGSNLRKFYVAGVWTSGALLDFQSLNPTSHLISNAF